MGAVLAEHALVRICDLAGRPRGTGFLADGLGTVITSHEAVDGLGRVVVNTRDERSHLAESDDITPLPEWDLALIRTDGLGVSPLVIGAERAGDTPVRLRTGQTSPAGEECWTDARLAGTASVTYTSTDRFHALEEVLELELPEAAAVELRLSRRASGSPVLDAETGAVLAVLGTALHAPGRAAGFAVPLRAAGLWEPDGPLGTLLARNGATVAGFGPDLNLAGALRLTAATVRPAVERVRSARRVHRPEVADDLRRFMDSGASAAALVGRPGTGRTTELAALAARRTDDVAVAPTVWLRGADLRTGDGGVREAVGRALADAEHRDAQLGGGTGGNGVMGGNGGPPSADVVARLARDAKRPLLVLLDAPEEMPLGLARELKRWTAGTVSWLRASGARMVIACGPEHWEQAGEFFPTAMLHEGADGPDTAEGTALPPCVRIGDLPAEQAARARERYGLDDGSLAEGDAGHPLAMRMLAEIRGALNTADCGSAAPSRTEIFSAHLDLVALRIAGRVAAHLGRAARDGAVRRLAVRAAGALHEAARRCLGPGQGAVGRADFEEVFPRRSGWRSAVLEEGVVEEAGDQFRFVDEEFADWLQGRHLEVEAALAALVHERTGQSVELETPGASDRSCAPAVPRHRIGPVVQALLLCDRLEGPAVLERRLLPLVDVCFEGVGPESVWWATRLLKGTLRRVTDARPYDGVLSRLAERIAADGHSADFGPGFWRRLRLPTGQKTELLRLMLPADPLHRAEGGHGNGRCLDVVDELAAADPETVLPLLCGWFTDRRALSGGTPANGLPQPTVASAAQALLYAHRGRAPGLLLDLLIDACHPRADELLGELAQDEPAALCRAVERWAHDERSLRRVAAAEYGTQMARHARTDAEREHLAGAARALLRRSGELSLHASAMALLLRISADRDQHLDAALDLLGATGAGELSEALTRALRERPEPVLAAFRARLGEPGSGAHHLVEALAGVTDAGLAVATAELVREYAELRPERAAEALAPFVLRRLTRGSEDRAGLQLLTDALLSSPCAPLRASLVRALGDSGPGPLRDELLDVLLLGERDMTVLDAALAAVVRGGHVHAAEDAGGPADRPGRGFTAELVRRIGLLMARTPEGAACFDRRLVELSREVPGFAELLRAWAEAAPNAWAAVVGPSARRMCDALADRA